MTDEEIVKAIAEKVFGLTVELRWCQRDPECGGWEPLSSQIAPLEMDKQFWCYHPVDHSPFYWRLVPDSLTSETDNAAVLNQLGRTGWDWSVHYCGEPFIPEGKRYECQLHWLKEPQREVNAFSHDSKRAVCLAALKAVGVDVG